MLLITFVIEFGYYGIVELRMAYQSFIIEGGGGLLNSSAICLYLPMNLLPNSLVLNM